MQNSFEIITSLSMKCLDQATAAKQSLCLKLRHSSSDIVTKLTVVPHLCYKFGPDGDDYDILQYYCVTNTDIRVIIERIVDFDDNGEKLDFQPCPWVATFGANRTDDLDVFSSAEIASYPGRSVPDDQIDGWVGPPAPPSPSRSGDTTALHKH